MQEMISKKIQIDKNSDMNFFENLYLESFPSNERRSIEKMHNLLQTDDRFNAYLLINQDRYIGFYTIWDFKTFSYLEHFAICPQDRNGGCGQQAISKIINDVTLPLFAEIELPETSTYAARRLGFYQRQGFKVWDIPYFQPPYQTGDGCLPLKLISYGQLNTSMSIENIISILHSQVYLYTKIC